MADLHLTNNPVCDVTFQRGKKQKLHAVGGCPGLGKPACNRVLPFGKELCPHCEAIQNGRIWTKEHPRGAKPMQVFAQQSDERRRA